jgi:transposase
MRVTAKRYTDDFRADALELINRGDRSFHQLGLDLGVSEWTLRHWYSQEQMGKRSSKRKRASAASTNETAEQKVERLERELNRLQRENDSLRTDREILKKAAAFFAKESE